MPVNYLTETKFPKCNILILSSIWRMNMVTNHFPVYLITHPLSCGIFLCVISRWFVFCWSKGLVSKAWTHGPPMYFSFFLFVGSLLLESAFIASVGCCAVRVMEAEQRLIQGSAVSEALPGRGWSLARPWQRSVLVRSRSLFRPCLQQWISSRLSNCNVFRKFPSILLTRVWIMAVLGGLTSLIKAWTFTKQTKQSIWGILKVHIFSKK